MRTAKRSYSPSSTGYRESTDSWAAALRDRGLTCPKLVTGDGALGAWAALRDVFPQANEQRWWVDKTANVLDALPKRLQPRAKELLHEMAEAPARADARAVLSASGRNSTPSTQGRREARPRLGAADRALRLPRRALAPPAGEPDRACLRDRQAAHPGDQGRRLKEGSTGNVAYKLLVAAQERWRRSNGHELVAEVLEGVTFTDGTRVEDTDYEKKRRKGRRLTVLTCGHPQHLTVALGQVR